MPLWGDTDDANSVPKFLSDSADVTRLGQSDDHVFFVDTDEAQVEANRAKGLQTPGWNLYDTYVDSDGVTRNKVEVLVPMKRTAVEAGDDGITANTDIEDQTVADS